MVEQFPEELETAIPHEVWHLIESESGIIESEPLIFESTANYAALRGRKTTKERNYKFTSFKDHKYLEIGYEAWYAYQAGAAIVTEIVEELNPQNPLIALSDISVRRRIAEKYSTDLEKYLRESIA